MYTSLRNDLNMLSMKYSNTGWASNLDDFKCYGIAAFYSICGFMKNQNIKELHRMDCLTLEFTGMTESGVIESQPVINEFYDAFKSDLSVLLEKYTNLEWNEMPHGLPTLRFLNRSLRLRSQLLIKFEMSIMAIQRDFYKQCYVCQSSDNTRRCVRCLSVYYCSTKCQSMDWSKHKLTCKK
jgi:hypothetical protein